MTHPLIPKIIDLATPIACDLGLELVDRQGQPVQGGSSSGSMNGVKQFQKYASEEALKDAILKLRFRDGGKKVEIPFDLSDVEVSK